MIKSKYKQYCETTDSLSHSEVSEISIPTSSSLILGFTIPEQVPTKTFRTNFYPQDDPNKSEMSASKDKLFDATNHIFQLSQFKRTPRGMPLHNLFTDFINQLQTNSNVTNQSNRYNDLTFMLNTTRAIVPSVSRRLMVPLKFCRYLLKV